jgi:hypothetical protein
LGFFLARAGPARCVPAPKIATTSNMLEALPPGNVHFAIEPEISATITIACN